MKKIFEDIGRFLEKFLPKKIMFFLYKFLNVQFFTFLVIGVINTLSSTVFATVLDAVKLRIMSPAMVKAIDTFRGTFILGYILGLFISFFLNTYFTFHEKPTWRKLIRFPLSYIPNFIIQYVFVYIFTALHWNSSIAYLTAAVIGIPITFLIMKVFVYKKK